MRQFIRHALTSLMLLASAATAVELSDLSPKMTRVSADETLTKDYAYRVMSDLSVRRIWNLDENRKLTIDFDTRTGKLICIVVDYRKPVSLDEADKDAADIGKFKKAKWKKFSREKAAKYFMGRARAMKFKQGYMFQEVTGANKCMRLTFFTSIPKEDRRLLTEGSLSSKSSAMGSTLGGSPVKALLADEEKRLFTPNKTDRKKEVAAEEPDIIDEPDDEEDTEFTDDDAIAADDSETADTADTPDATGKVVKGPVTVKPIKTVEQKGDRSSDVQNLLAKLGLDKLSTLHWILIAVGLVVLITILSAVGRSKERRKLEQRADSLRRSSASTSESLRKNIKK